ncbi:MAG TPA: GDP-mannose 4,6-dehydratase, partial [Planctomycetota bacterium]|nr:GDP-mannose 4,6-dehydratase [Planctomycetota bacterium]
MALYLVTGGAGFIGSHIASALVERGDRVRILD